jgi:hypothetical protein
VPAASQLSAGEDRTVVIRLDNAVAEPPVVARARDNDGDTTRDASKVSTSAPTPTPPLPLVRAPSDADEAERVFVSRAGDRAFTSIAAAIAAVASTTLIIVEPGARVIAIACSHADRRRVLRTVAAQREQEHRRFGRRPLQHGDDRRAVERVPRDERR